MTQPMIDFKTRVNYGKTITGWLLHDNKLFDRTCPQCGGMYSSFLASSCKKCGQPLTYIRTGDGRAMAISEGTLGIALPKTQIERDEKSIKARKGGMLITHRFKLFSFEENGVLSPHPLHKNLRTGSLVEVRIINHQELTKPFRTRAGAWKIELMYPVYDQYGDTVKILRGPKAADVTTPHGVTATGAAAPITVTANTEIAALQKQMAEMQARINALGQAPAPTTAAPTPTPPPAPPVQNAVAASVEAAMDEECPFDVDDLDMVDIATQGWDEAEPPATSGSINPFSME